jgi:hypothetical protein
MLPRIHNRRMFFWLLRRTCGNGAIMSRGSIDSSTGAVLFRWNAKPPSPTVDPREQTRKRRRGCTK